MTRYHDNYDFTPLLKEIIDENENQEMRSLLIGNWKPISENI